MNKKASLIALVLTLAPLTADLAFEVPQSRQEFIQAVEAGKGATTIDKLQVDVPLNKVYSLLQEKAAACLDMKVQRTAYVGYVERSSSDYNPTVRLVGKDKVEFSLQVEHNPRGVGGGPPPPGGLYMMAADLRAIDGHRTEIVLYRSSIGVKKIVASLNQWFAGDPAPCPKLR